MANVLHRCTDPHAVLTSTHDEDGAPILQVTTNDPDAQLVEFRPDGTATVMSLSTCFAEFAPPLVAAALSQCLQSQEEARDAYRPARAFYGPGKQFRNLWQLRRFLEKHPEIRTRRPTLRRLEIHVGDWCTYLGTVDPLELPADLVERFVAEDQEIRRRQAQEGARRHRSGD
jgi:hypothetical protein